VAVLSLALALALPKSFFDDWGWVVGPGAWIACAALTARQLRLPQRPTLIGAAVAGLISVPAVLLGLHWLGVVIAVGLFAAWCARLSDRTRVAAWTSG
jgi:hypothetical protein